MAYNIISTAMFAVANTLGKFLRVSATTISEIFTVSGRRFSNTFDIQYSGGETRYFLYSLPIEAQVTVGLQNRIFKSKDGEAEIEILWDSTGFTEGTITPVFCEYNKYTGNNLFRTSEITAPSVEGILRESDFLTATGKGSNTSGAVASKLGFRLYEPGTFFIAKVTNLENSTNRIHLSYSWIELSDKQVALT